MLPYGVRIQKHRPKSLLSATRKGENCFRSYSVLELCVFELEFNRLAFLLLLSALVKDFYCTTQMRNRD